MQTTPDQPIHDVMIAGAGPVGLFLACELALAHCSVLILEKSPEAHSPVKRMPFGMRGLSTPSIEAFHRRGLLDALEIHKRIKNPHATPPGPQPPRQSGHFAGIPLLEENIDTARWPHRLPTSTPTMILSEIEEVETVLTRRAEMLGVEIRRGMAITGLDQTPDGVAVRSGDKLFRARWLVGCDGGRSIVRKAGGFEFAGTEPDFTGYSAQVDIADPEKLKPGRNLTEKGMYLQSQPGYLIIQDFDGGSFHGGSFHGGSFHTSDTAPTLEHVQEVIRRISGTNVTLTALHAATTWTDRARQSTSYRNGRVLLAGDAAHIHSPLGGQGLNLGLGDAMNLGWKLAATIRGLAPEGLLDSYHTERHPIGMQVLEWSRAQVAIMKPDPQARALNAIVRDLINTRDGATYIASRMWGIFMHYDLDGAHALTGYSVPNFEFKDGTTIGEMLRDGLGMLLNLGDDHALRSLADEFGGRVKYVSGEVKDSLGIRATLIRPDGIVAWATNGEANCEEARTVMRRWFIPQKFVDQRHCDDL